MSKTTTTIKNDYTSIKFQIDVVIFSLVNNSLRILLVPSQEENRWKFPGQDINQSDSIEKIAISCISSITDIQDVYLEQLYTYGDTNRSSEDRIISIVYFAVIPSGYKTKKQDDQIRKWFPVNNMPELILDQTDILEYAVRRLRYKLEYSAVAFELLPEFFTLSELQHTYEIILGENLDKRNFRKRILKADIIEPTNNHRSGEGRPARLYRYKPDAVAEVKARRLFP